MQKKYLIRAALVLLLIAGSFFVLWSSARISSKKETCKESLEDCSQNKGKTPPSGEMIWETLSHQFFSSVEISR